MSMYFFLAPVAFVFCFATCIFLVLWVKKQNRASPEEIELEERNLHGNAALQHNNPLYFLGRTITYRKLHVSEWKNCFYKAEFKAKNDIYMTNLYQYHNKTIFLVLLTDDWALLGSGEFGLVRKATFEDSNRGINCVAAVKTAKCRARDFQQNSNASTLISEINIMKIVGSHPNIVEVIDYSTDIILPSKKNM